MKQRILVLLLLIFSLFWLFGLPQPTQTDMPLPVVQVTEIQADAGSTDIPVRLEIPSISLSAAVMPMGLTAEKIVDTPEYDVGWYTGGVKPGQVGTMAFNGHVRNRNLQPGIFSRLDEVTTGDEVRVTDAQGQTYTYTVTKTELVDVTAFPLTAVYGHMDEARLTIVTCAGAYDPATDDYLQRTIVYATYRN